MDDKQLKEIIRDELKKNNIVPTELIFEQLDIYYEELVDYNSKVNLTALTSKEDIYIKHFTDCIALSKIYKQSASVCDIGTGAGFPGLVLKIIRPDLNVVLVDSLNKRVDFLNHMIKTLNLSNIVALHYRAEDKEFKDRYLNSFNFVIARAVANMTTLTEYCLPFVCIGGKFVAYKSDNIDDELVLAKKCIGLLGGQINSILEYNICDNKRKIVIIDKVKPTADKYPRDMNKPRLKPIS